MDSNALLLPLCFFGLYMILEAADWGLTLAAPFVCRTAEERKAALGLLKPGLDGNEIWFFMGAFTFSAAVPSLSAGTYHTQQLLLLAFVAVGALLRLLGAYVRQVLSSAIALKAGCLFSVVALALMGFAGTSFLTEGSFFSVLGFFCALWMILASFQMGSLYGAVKVVNPLGERFRAAFLVSSVLSVVCCIISAILLKLAMGDSYFYGSFFWLSLVAAALLFVVSFFAARQRHVKVGLAAAYVSSFFAIAIYLSAYVVETARQYDVDVTAMKAALDGIPSTAILAVAAVWTLGAFVWKLLRKKEEYVFTDTIFNGLK